VARVWDLLFDVSPYEGFDPAPYPDDMQGWGSDHPVLTEAIRALKPASVVEVGSWKGRSAINMALAAKEARLATEIVCVDTWLGSPEHWDRHAHPDWYQSLHMRNGWPLLYYVFLANVVRHGVADVITPFPNTSDNAAAMFRQHGIRFDLAYIDAAHEYESASRDFETYYDLLNPGGLLIGDDYAWWEGVTRAADDFARRRKLHLAGEPGKFVVAKDNQPPGIDLVRRWAGQSAEGRIFRPASRGRRLRAALSMVVRAIRAPS
jgi:SAM-dependent methyltransferase